MRKSVILFLFLILFTPISIEADTIVLKNGTRIKVDQTWKKDGQIKCYRFGAVIGYSLDSIEHIEIDEKSEKKILSTPHEIYYRDKKKENYDKPIKATRIRAEIREFSKRKYPNDYKMQQYIYKKQMAAYRYMLNVTDSEVKKIAVRKYPNDYSMQKYTYDKQLSAKRYMRTVEDMEIKQISIRKYATDYSMQKYTYDKQLSAKHYMKTVASSNAKLKAQRKYPNDYSMQKYTYEKIVNRY